MPDQALAEKLLKLKGMDAQFYFNRGVERSKSGDLHGAVEDYSAAIILASGTTRRTVTTKHPDGSSESVSIVESSEGNENMYFNRACTYLDLGNYADAANDLSKFIEYNQNDAEAFFKRAIANYCLERDEEVEQDLKSAAALNPKYNREAFQAVFRG